MNISLYQFELQEAIALYLKKEHNIVLDTDDIDYTSIDYQEREEVFKKHKNGRVVKNEHGHPQVDWENSPYKTKHISMGEIDEIHLSIINRGEPK
jgi:hypothetical protein|tara:strand:- start:212 stop:496 length:285 start_codon:yes stop_codon:yes gene_type:complete